MNTLERWAKFNLVGVIGMGLQLTLLALLNRNMAGHYLFASCVAVEITLLHNFAWHWHYTWRDRRGCVSSPGSLVRFHLSNGAVSMFGNLVLMQLLVHRAHLPLLIANVLAILSCSVANFCIGDGWAFRGNPKSESIGPCKAASAPARST
jgi:putative flippase GtrA